MLFGLWVLRLWESLKVCRCRQRRVASKVCFVSFCFGQTTQPVTGKHQLSRGWSGGRVRGRRRGPCWINQSRQESPVIISINQSYLVCPWCWTTLPVSLQVQPSPYPEHLHPSPSHLRVPLAPAAKHSRRLKMKTSLSASPSPSRLQDLSPKRKEAWVDVLFWFCYVFLKYKYIQYMHMKSIHD